MDDNRTWQRLAAEFLGTAFLVFVGVGSVPAFALVRGDAPSHPPTSASSRWPSAPSSSRRSTCSGTSRATTSTRRSPSHSP